MPPQLQLWKEMVAKSSHPHRQSPSHDKQHLRGFLKLLANHLEAACNQDQQPGVNFNSECKAASYLDITIAKTSPQVPLTLVVQRGQGGNNRGRNEQIC